MLTIAKNVNRRLTALILSSFSSKNQPINQAPAEFIEKRVALQNNIWRTPDPTHLKSYETHLSNAQYLSHKTPIVYTDRETVRCLGGTQIGPGHPQVYIQLNTRTPGQPVACKYCGMRYALKHHH